MKLSSYYKDFYLLENWKGAVAASVMAASLLNPTGTSAANSPDSSQHTSNIISPESYISQFENSKANKHGGWDNVSKKWFPHDSYEGGNKTIGYGHKIVSGEDFSKGISDQDALQLLKKDISKAESLANSKITGYKSLPQGVKNSILNAFYRGDLGPKAISHMNNDDWRQAAKEYLNNAEYKREKSRHSSISTRMEDNARNFLTLSNK